MRIQLIKIIKDKEMDKDDEKELFEDLDIKN